MKISLIAAMARNRVIGRGNQLPWHLPEDLKFFREKTKFHICVMGRKTFESVGSKPLPHRLNVVISRSEEFARSVRAKLGDSVPVFTSLEDALKYCESEVENWGKEIFICGGGEIYQQALPKADRLYLTILERDVEGDAFFPEWNSAEFRETQRSERTEPERFAFVTLERNRI